ncbi:head-to-tail adaptor [Gordonia phage Syleon]|uniref:Head-to-tail adaptor n=3 Tax=Octobienvirus TaxID=3044779 RepID=A0AAE8Y636_9CAUD|nr:head-to-tail adaptor [Gordonia Phage Sephiroth]YP_010246536.1 head-to-tail adaptor [Gordonia phage Kudefre]YP_010246677.1 head-to-tail adaptor [Gordonia phage Syleon]QGH75747.1 head-to-tail adaptor [Gordonia phage Syleon]QNN99362.1 head-to-tail adaptor [Gordonia Phage Sephiroth]UDL15252.1 head-to-tail adaptor [Gordonia phage Kudefre]
MGALASVDRLSARLGVTLAPGNPDYVRAEEALWSSSVRARGIAEREWEDPATVPDEVLDVVLSAAFRIFKNPDRFLTNQAGTFQATLAQSDFATGDIFLPAEVAILEKHRPQAALRVLSIYRDDPREKLWHSEQFVADGGAGEPMLVYRPDEVGY